ncbi:hypothetical protein ACLIMP_10125 [Novosphingobium aerophilum]|uniref:hypothetical protein n=1 Tax=Novosphingobium TaxID=165696 RepID=UPI0006C8BFE2|nr:MULTISPECIES: hypothetical protein [unclassified Novosphingobium]KPH58740.1 hypothetical protein ADT71_25860 [Novosphingobium sp. ST904]MPS70705.1 hypothetical protein [Novosphingobium sp.]TCM42242.1 hypothetical protein EDF59_102206 [Novosphingobium sp. ST904]WRT91509.1 hypothetical protein U9J33_09730 [Novosphingobium sp. RL4]
MNDSDKIMAAVGGVAALFAVIAWIGDRRRMKRRDLDRVGFMPWTTVFFFALMLAVLLLGVAGRDWFAG